MSKVKLDGVSKVYNNGYHAVSDISLEIQDGEFMVLVGPSGCAKSTMLRMVAGLESITSGQLTIGDTICNDLPPKDRGIAMVFQNYALYPHMTTYENMAFGLETAKKSKLEIERRVSEAAELLEITELLARKPKQMSGGQRQRVALGRAMVRKPDVFLFDEPLSNLDAKLRVSMRMRITRLHQKLKDSGYPATMIYVTHDQVEAMTMGDRVCILNHGQIMQVDTPMNVYHKPKNRFVAEFIGSPAMNMLSAQVVKSNGQWGVDFGGKWLVLPSGRQAQAEMWLVKKVHVGARPEHLNLHFEPSVDRLAADVEAIEELGSEVYLHLTVLGRTVVCKQSDQAPLPMVATRCFIELTMEKCHLFDDATENNLFYS